MEKEKCVVCGDHTPYVKQDGIDDRKYYIDGAGQLCKKCHSEIYVK
jgi:hypothetical protein